MTQGSVWDYVIEESFELINWAKCDESYYSVIPTLLWGIGTAILAHRIINAIFRRFLFRRVPLWESIMEQLLYVWMIMYSLHFWMVLVKLIAVFVDYFYDIDQTETADYLQTEEISSYEDRKVMKQVLTWFCGLLPISIYIQTRPKPETPPLMIWITTHPWQRREMGPYGYYLNRPLTSLQSEADVSIRKRAMDMRRAFSDSKLVFKDPPKKRRYSKSV